MDGTNKLGPSLASYLHKRNEGRLLVINIESVPAIENLENLLEVPSIDAVLIGPHDLSVSLEIPEEYSHPKFDKAVRSIIETARAKGVGAGVHYWANIEQEIDWPRHGINMILHHGDITLYSEALKGFERYS